MITIAATFHCDTAACDNSVKGRLEVQYLAAQGRPAGFSMNPQTPAGWSAISSESRIQAPGRQGPQVGQVSFICTTCTKALKSEAEAKPSSLIVSA